MYGWISGDRDIKLFFPNKNSVSNCMQFLVAGLEIFKTFKLVGIINIKNEICLFEIFHQKCESLK